MGFTLYDTNCTSFVGNTVIRLWISFVGCSLVSAFLYTEICTQMNKFSKYSITVNLAGVFGWQFWQFWQFCPQSTGFNCHVNSICTYSNRNVVSGDVQVVVEGRENRYRTTSLGASSPSNKEF